MTSRLDKDLFDRTELEDVRTLLLSSSNAVCDGTDSGYSYLGGFYEACMRSGNLFGSLKI
jgi:hypothetical protein